MGSRHSGRGSARARPGRSTPIVGDDLSVDRFYKQMLTAALLNAMVFAATTFWASALQKQG